MALYRLKKEAMNSPVSRHVHDDGHIYKGGEVIEDDRDLMKLFPLKFEEVETSAAATTPTHPKMAKQTKRVSTPAPIVEQLVAEEIEDEDEPAPPPAKAAKTAKHKKPVEDPRGVNVTDDFPKAVEFGFSVFQAGPAKKPVYNVYQDGEEDSMNVKPLKKNAVEDYILDSLDD
jgi:hypothetical protein